MNTIVNEATKPSLPAASPTAQHLIHVICLPLQLKRKGKPITQIDDAVQGLTADGCPWHDANGPLLAELTPEQRWQARVYFHPFVRGFLFDAQRSRWLQRSDIKALRVTLPQTHEPVTMTVLRCQLVLFQPDIACLLLELDCQQSLPIDTLQRLLDRLRRVYPPYFDSFQPKPSDVNPTPEKVWFGGHCADKVELLDAQRKPIGDAGGYAPTDYAKSLTNAGCSGSWKPGWSAHWKTLLAPLHTDNTPADGVGIRQFGDDRAAIMSYIAFDDVRSLNPGQWARLCFSDDHGTDPLPYAKKFLAKFEQRYAYDRYWYTGSCGDEVTDSKFDPSRIFNCGYAFTYAGTSSFSTDDADQRQPSYFINAENGALFTYRHIYVTMGLIAHMQRAAMLAASFRLSEFVSREGADITLPDRNEVRNFYNQFVEFTQTYWFDEVTPQEQGQQIFDQWREHLRIQSIYNEVRQELRDLAEYSELRATNRLNDNVIRLGLFSLTLTALAVLTGLLGMNILNVNESTVSLNNEWIRLVWGPNLSWSFALIFGLAALAGLFALSAFLWQLRSLFGRAWRWLGGH